MAMNLNISGCENNIPKKQGDKMADDKCRKTLEEQLNTAYEDMEKKRNKLSRIIQEIKNDPSHNICQDEKVLKANMILSNAIQKYMRLEKRFRKDKSKFT
ncbi:MAG: hypothetical protein VB082_09825 [Christensenella sp.]|nr:hypothetical protein [Christensenella sp.]